MPTFCTVEGVAVPLEIPSCEQDSGSYLTAICVFHAKQSKTQMRQGNSFLFESISSRSTISN